MRKLAVSLLLLTLCSSFAIFAHDEVDEQLELEQALRQQQTLLKSAWKEVQPTDPNQINLYMVVIAGYGLQDVFLKEARYIKQQFDDHYGTDHRSVLLANNPQTLKSLPMATETSIEQTLRHVAGKMDPKNDILFLYMTSHGSEDHKFDISLNTESLSELPASRLASMINELPIRWKVLTVSACYSGGFIPALKTEDTLVMTAAREDRSSFGCSDDSDMTYFGKAYFKYALPQSDSFAEAFETATDIVHQWEVEKEHEPSYPQIHVGRKIKKQLKQWRRQLL